MNKKNLNLQTLRKKNAAKQNLLPSVLLKKTKLESICSFTCFSLSLLLRLVDIFKVYLSVADLELL